MPAGHLQAACSHAASSRTLQHTHWLPDCTALHRVAPRCTDREVVVVGVLGEAAVVEGPGQVVHRVLLVAHSAAGRQVGQDVGWTWSAPCALTGRADWPWQPLHHASMANWQQTRRRRPHSPRHHLCRHVVVQEVVQVALNCRRRREMAGQGMRGSIVSLALHSCRGKMHPHNAAPTALQPSSACRPKHSQRTQPAHPPTWQWLEQELLVILLAGGVAHQHAAAAQVQGKRQAVQVRTSTLQLAGA